MLTDLIQIRALGEKKRPENERFRRYLNSRHHSDRILRRIAERIQEQMDCTTCGSCCRVATVEVKHRDVDRLASHLGIPRAQFMLAYTERDKDIINLKWTEGKGCVFLEGNECGVYEARPDACARFPHLVRGQGSMVSRMWKFIDRACYCPIVYNALEAFKVETRFQR